MGEEVQKSKKQFENKLAKDIKNNRKRCYAYVRSKTEVKEVFGLLKDSNGQLATD